MRRGVVVTGLGFVSCIGNDQRRVLDSLLQQRSGLSRTAFFDNPDLPVKLVGKPADFDVEGPNWRNWKTPAAYEIDQSLKRSLSPHGVYAICAVDQALRSSGIERESLRGDAGTGLYAASAGSPLLLYENLDSLRKAGGERGNPLGILSSIAGTLNFNLNSWLGIRGSNCGFVSACASSSHALGYAFDDISLGRQERAIVVGAEDPTAESLMPFMSMRALSTNPDPCQASRPFDSGRDGFVGAGGAVALVLEEEDVARRRGATIWAEFAGWAQSSDGYHRTSPHPQGEGLAAAMSKAMAAAGMDLGQLDYINAHATSTKAGDIAEAKAIQGVLGSRCSEVPVSSIKGIAGHSLSMAGVLEMAVCCLALRNRLLPGNAHLQDVDSECAHLNLPRQPEERSLTWILNNSSGFGGSNVCHVLKRHASASH